MGLKIDPELIDCERARTVTYRVEVEPQFVNWKKVVELANKNNQTIEEVLGIEPFSKPPDLDSHHETVEMSDEVTPLFYKAAQKMNKPFGATAEQYLAIYRIILQYSSYDPRND